MWTTDAISLYQDHVPQSVDYPCICYYHISSVNKYAMPTTTAAKGLFVELRFELP